MKSVTLEVLPRTKAGQKASAVLRRNEQVPCVLYGKDKHLLFVADYNQLRKVLYTPDFQKIIISCNGETYETILKEIQYHPVTDRVIHADFLWLRPGKRINTTVPVKFVGQAAGVKDGGILYTKVRNLRISCLPEHLVSEIEINVDDLALGKQIRVKDISIANIAIAEMPEKPLCAVYTPRAVVVEEEKPAVAAATAEGAASPAAAGTKPGETAKADDKKGGDKGKK
jgi:large subunit ribosomal protein L25